MNHSNKHLNIKTTTNSCKLVLHCEISKMFHLKKIFTTKSDDSLIDEVNSDIVNNDSPSICCRICGSKERKNLLFNPCSCVGQSEFIHRKCISIWFKKARYDVLCCQCKLKFTRIKYNKSLFWLILIWINETPKVKKYIIIGVLLFTLFLSIIIYGIAKAMSSGINEINEILLVPTLIFGVLTIWKLIGSLAIIIVEFRKWKFDKINAKCCHKH